MASKLFSLAAIWMNILFFLLEFQAFGAKKLKFHELTAVQLTSRLKNSAFEEAPFCVVYKSSSAQTELEKTLSGFAWESPYKKWTFARIDTTKHAIPPDTHPGILPLLQCYTGQSSHLQYWQLRPTVKSLTKWLKSVRKSFMKRISAVNSESIAKLVLGHHGTTVVGIPGYYFQEYLEDLLNKIRKKWKSSVQVAIVPSQSDDASNICQYFGVQEFPALLIFDRQEWDENQQPGVVLQGQLNAGFQQVKLELAIRDSQCTVLNMGNFEKEVLETEIPMSPIAVTFYSHNNLRSISYMDLLKTTVKGFADIDASFRFGMVNLANSVQVIRHVNASLVSSFPFTVVFWQEKQSGESNYIIKQAALTKGIPTVETLYNFLVSHDVPLSLDEDTDLSWLERKELTCGTTELIDNKCEVSEGNITNSDFITNAKVFGPELAPTGWTDFEITAPPANKSTPDDAIPFVTDKTWAATIEQSVKPTKTYGIPLTNQQHSKPYRVSLVVFVKGNCGYCTKIMPLLQDMANQVKLIGVSMYLMNCSTDPVHCKKHGITGFPTLTAFRSLSWALAGHCFPTGQRSRYIRVDYHGAIVTSLLLDWLSSINTPAVNKEYMDTHLPDNMEDDVYLVATLYTRSLARRYLSSTLIDKWYSYQCYTLVCELLYGLVPCYAIYTRDVVDHVAGTRNDKDLIVSKLSIQRKDGVRANIFELGYSLAFTLNHDRNSRLHSFHKPHRYNLPNHFKCEDDHRTCTDYVVQFVRDHRRLPVTQITTAIFHTKTGAQDTSDVFSQNLPVMLILAHRQNISRDSVFYRELTSAAYTMYQDIVFATVNVDEFSYWASRFVPKDYGSKYAYDTSFLPTLFHYPRLCIVRWHDHQHAAFYPPVDELERLGTRVQDRLNKIDAQQIIKFAQNFLKNPEKVAVRTEMF